MASEKIIAAIGVSDEDVAHLRLLMRKAASDLSFTWRWGSDGQADLLLVDTSALVGQMARMRAKTSGMRVAVVCDADHTIEGDPILVRPFKLNNVIDVLNAGTATGPGLSTSVRSGEGYYHASDSDADSARHDFGLGYSDSKAAQEALDTDVAPGLDELIRGDPLADPRANLRHTKFDDSVGIEGSSDPTKRSESRASRDRETRGDPTAGPSNIAPTAKRATPPDRSAHRLREYLEGNLLGGPVQIAWPDAGILTLDPKNRVYHSRKTLSSLEVYCRKSPLRSDWRRLTTAELTEVRESQPAQPYQKLIWLDVLLHSEGKLASNLDPGGTYELSRWLEMAPDYPHYARISSAMMQPLRLHEISASCRCEMSDVFNVANAYDAIGYLKWTPRAPRHAEPEKSTGMASFGSRIRNLFGKS